MDRGNIRDGITLFQFSNTGQQGGRATDVTRRLWTLFQNNAIGFHDLGRGTLHGDWNDRTGRLRINTSYMNGLPSTMRLGALSLLLVHEGTHATVSFSKFYDELAARILPIHYFRELAGPGVFNEASDTGRRGARTEIIKCPPGSLPYFDEQDEALKQDQLIDYIFSNSTYRKPRYINPQWVVENLGNWGGLSNRWSRTRGFYIKILAGSVDGFFNRAILDVMDSVTRRSDWDAMMRAAGPLRNIQVALDDLSTSPAFARRIVALERRWGLSLRDEPAVPAGRH